MSAQYDCFFRVFGPGVFKSILYYLILNKQKKKKKTHVAFYLSFFRLKNLTSALFINLGGTILIQYVSEIIKLSRLKCAEKNDGDL